MAVKRTIHEVCPICKEHHVRRNRDGSMTLFSCACGRRVPGPPAMPRRFTESEVIFVPSPEAAQEQPK
jgi:ribosomal protein L37AE/L43A